MVITTSCPYDISYPLKFTEIGPSSYMFFLFEIRYLLAKAVVNNMQVVIVVIR